MTPMLSQYLEIKEAHPDSILFFRLGDFYEMFFDDAKTAAGILNITLTSRDGTVPMCGVPAHAAESYLFKLVSAGHRVAVCEQTEEPGGGTIIRREVVRVVSRGTILEPNLLEEKRNNFLLALAGNGERMGLAAVDVSTGHFSVTRFEGAGAAAKALEEAERLGPVEVLLDPALESLGPQLEARTKASITPYVAHAFHPQRAARVLERHFGVSSLTAFGCAHLPEAIGAAGAAIAYLTETQKSTLAQLEKLQTYQTSDRMVLDTQTRRNLELTHRLNGDEGEGTLFWALDETVTPMGARALRQSLERPCVLLSQIRQRLEAVGELVGKPLLRAGLREELRQVKYLERLGARAAATLSGPRELLGLGISLSHLGPIKKLLAEAEASLLIDMDMDALEELSSRLKEAIAPDAPASAKDGGIIRPGFSPEVEALRTLSREGVAWMAELEARERERTGIRSVKIGFNRVFGYYLEVTKANLGLVPPEYQRRQTLASAERFVTMELKEKEEAILEAAERLLSLEGDIFADLQGRAREASGRILASARVLADLDVLLSLAEVAVRRGFVPPEVDDSGAIEISLGRHPVLERILGPGNFVPNDTHMTPAERFTLLTGPNMGGKSTYMRQVALIVLLAQMGSFVPAQKAHIGIVDRIFTRVGASDDLAGGRSTFMVEMSELAHILHHASVNSLLLLDEIGRGTSTYDGLAIAWAVAEHIHDRLGSKVIFATHYHELLELEGSLDSLRNYTVAVSEDGEDIVFLHQIAPGRGERSYGIQAARLAGVPGGILGRARSLLGAFQGRGEAPREIAASTPPDPLREQLLSLDLSNLTPLAALNILYSLQELAQDG